MRWEQKDITGESNDSEFGGAILPVCQTFSDTHTVDVSSVIAGQVRIQAWSFVIIPPQLFLTQ